MTTASQQATASDTYTSHSDATAGASRSEPLFHVTLVKFLVMSVLTWGIYDIYWSYQQWKRIRSRTGEKLMPLPRAIFAGITNFSLFPRLERELEGQGIQAPFNGQALAAGVFFIAMAWRLPDPWWLLGALTCLPMIPIITAIDGLSRKDATISRNDQWTVGNGVALAFGVLFSLLVVLGLTARG